MSDPSHVVAPLEAPTAQSTARTPSASPRSRPIDLAPLEGTSPVVAAGVGALLAVYAARVRVRRPGYAADVIVADLTQRPNPLRVPVVSAALVLLLREGDVNAAARARASGAEPLSIAAGPRRMLEAVEAAHRRSSGHPRVEGVPPDAPLPPVDTTVRLSAREVEVVVGICAGLSNAEIADQLFVSINSIKTYVRSAYRKMGVERRGQAVVWGLQHGYGVRRPAGA